MVLQGAAVFDTAEAADEAVCKPKVVVVPLSSAGVSMAVGDAVAGDVLAGKTFSNDSETGISGTMVDNRAVLITPGTLDQTISQGYHNGDGYVVGDGDLLSANIKSGVTLFGVSGQPEVVDTSSGDAVAGEILAGKRAWVDGGEVTGTIPTNTLSATISSFDAGYYEAGNLTGVDPDLTTDNIRAGVSLFGVTGESEIVDTSSGDAVAGEILDGKKAWVDGAEVTGTIPTNTLSATTSSFDAGYYEAGNLTGVDLDLMTDNIRAGVSLFGVEGNTNVVDTSAGDVIPSDIKSGKIAYSAGSQVVGTYMTGVTIVSRAWGCNIDLLTGQSAAWNQSQCETDCGLAAVTNCVQVCGLLGMSLDSGTSAGGVDVKYEFCNASI